MASKNGIKTKLGNVIGDVNEIGKGIARIILAPLGVAANRLPEAIKDFNNDMDFDDFKKKYGIKGTLKSYQDYFKRQGERITNPQKTRSVQKRNEEALRKAASSQTTSKKSQPTGAAANIPVSNQASKASSFSGSADWKNPEYVKSMIVTIGKQQGLSDAEIAFALAIAAKETGGSFNVNSHNTGTAKIPEDSYGVFQINKQAHPDYTAGLDPIGNITYGVRFAANKLRQANGDPRIAARNYNGSGQMAERYSQDFIKNFYPKYSNDYLAGNVGTTDVIASTSPEMARAQNAVQANQTLQQYASAAQPFSDETLRRGLGDLEILRQDAINRARNAELGLTPNELATYNQPYMDEASNIRNYAQNAANNIAQGYNQESYLSPMEQRLNKAYEDYYNRVNSLNPYDLMAQNLPISPSDVVANRTNATLAALANPNVTTPFDRAAYKQAYLAAQNYGMTPEQYYNARNLDYLTAQKAEAQRISDYNALLKAYGELQEKLLAAQQGIINQGIVSGATVGTKGADLAKEDMEGKQERMKQEVEANTKQYAPIAGLYGSQISAQSGVQRGQEANYTDVLNTLQRNQSDIDVEQLRGQNAMNREQFKAGVTGTPNLKFSDVNTYFRNINEASLNPEMRNNLPNLITQGVNIGILTPEQGKNWLKGFGFGE